ncbi:ExbD/TolR family protein [Marivita sp. S0852]|uniref:ExbD/TolR family protein n=1 Tax=Marivita sp. S0852 TaxID=3373893 RepID=UPI003982BF06
MTHRLSLSTRARRRAREPVVPMINVVFLLLIFFLMTAQIVPPAPFDMQLATAVGDEDMGQDGLYLNAQGDMAFADLRGEAAMRAAVEASADAPLRIFADASLRAATLAGVLADVSALGMRRVELVTDGG